MNLSTKNPSYNILKTAVYCIIVFIGVTVFSCGQNKGSENNELPSTDSTIFYPVREYFLSQISSVDSARPHIYMLTNKEGGRDSATITIEQFDKIAQVFLENDIADISVKKYYRQSVFQDQTTSSYTFNYTTVNSSLPVRNLDVLLDTTTQTVKRVFISKVKTSGDTSINEKLSWKNDNSFLINRSIEISSKEKIEQQISVVWHDNN